MTPLHWAVERGNYKSCEILIQYGADVNYESKFGKCPLELASEQGRPDIFELLQNAEHIRAEAVAMMTDSSVSDPLTMAATNSITDELTTAVNTIEEVVTGTVGDSAGQGNFHVVQIFWRLLDFSHPALLRIPFRLKVISEMACTLKTRLTQTNFNLSTHNNLIRLV